MHFIVRFDYKPKALKVKTPASPNAGVFLWGGLFADDELVVGDVHHIGGFRIDLSADDGTAK